MAFAQVSCFIGGFLAGTFADNYGRKKTIVIMSILSLISALGMCLSPNLWIYFICWLSINLWSHIGYMAVSVYSLEILGPSKREWSVFISLAFGVGYLISSPIAYFLPHWRIMTSAIVVLYLSFLPMLYYCPESPNWLLIMGRNADAKSVLLIFEKNTQSEIPELVISGLVATKNDKKGMHIELIFPW